MSRIQIGLITVFSFFMSVSCASLRSGSNTVTVVVKKNETLRTIADTHGVTWESIVQQNRPTLTDGLREGQVLKIAVNPDSLPLLAETHESESSPEEDLDDEDLDFLKRPNKGLLVGPQSKEPISLIYPVEARISSHFGKRGRKNHKGIDLAANVGTPILAAGDGDVIASGRQRGYGLTVIIDHGQFMTLYAHASKLIARVGSKVRQGDFIAKVGRSGNARGAHLHFELRDFDNKPLDPELYLHRKSVVKAGHSRNKGVVASSKVKSRHPKISSKHSRKGRMVAESK